MGVAQPNTEFASTARLDGVFTNVGLKVLGTDPTRIQPGEELDEPNDVGLLGGTGGVGIRCCYGVEESP